VVLIGVLSAGWTAHQNVARSAALRASDWAAAEDVRWRTQVGLSVLWTASAAVALLWGFVRSVPAARYGGLALLGLVLVKVFTVDLEAVSTGYRVTSFLVLGLALLGVSYLYQRARRSS
jgi:uncharacterized membrane protein